MLALVYEQAYVIVMNDEKSLQKQRLIHFSDLHPNADQAGRAMLLLSDVEGIIKLHHIHRLCLSVEFDIKHLNLKIIEQALMDIGFHLDNSLLVKLKRALYYYTEEAQQANLGYTKNCKDFTKRIFINEYHHHEHGCRDERDEHWREYR